MIKRWDANTKKKIISAISALIAMNLPKMKYSEKFETTTNETRK